MHELVLGQSEFGDLPSDRAERLYDGAFDAPAAIARRPEQGRLGI